MGFITSGSASYEFLRLNQFFNKAGQFSGVVRTILLMAIALAAFATRLFSVIRYESVIHEFDPWFNFRATKYLVENGWYAFLNWFDERSWYPLGRVVGVTVYPGIMATSAVFHYISNKVLALGLDIRDICVFLAPVFAGLTAIATYHLTKELADGGAALLAAAFIAICPGYISRSVAGSYDNEGIAIFLMMATFYCWIKAVKKGSSIWSVWTALMYFYMVSSWGGYVFIINLIPLHVFVLLLMGRYGDKLYRSYCTFYIIGTIASMTLPFVGLQPTRSSEHMAALGVFCLLQLMAIGEIVRKLVDDEDHFRNLVKTAIVLLAAFLGVGLFILTMKGHVAPWAGRFRSLWDTSYAKKHIPIIASVSEHQPTPWGSFFFDMNILLFTAPVGLFLCFRSRRDEHVFAIMYILTATYFAAVMVRLILTLAPIMCVLGAIGVSRVFDLYTPGPSVCDNSDEGPDAEKKIKSPSTLKIGISIRTIVLFPFTCLMAYYVWHCTWVTSSAYSSPSIMMTSQDPRSGRVRIIDDFREAFYWLRRNTPDSAKVMAWWDYGYQIAGMADRTTIVDNNTWNNTHIATVGLAFALPEEKSYPVLRKLDTDYVLVLSGAISGFGGDDINKFLWMVRIAEGVFPEKLRESEFLTSGGDYRVDMMAPPAMRESLLYKMTYSGVAPVLGPNPIDRARQVSIKGIDPKLSIADEVYSTDNHIVRIFKIRSPDVLGRSLFKH